MAKLSMINKNNKRIETYLRYKDRVRELKAKGDYVGLQKLPRDASITRIRNRDSINGRQRGYIRKFGLSRMNFRKLASEGKIPGVKKASW